jgi:nucleoside-diphosphate-sugar epimerase
MKILLIGGCGYVGSALGEFLSNSHDITNVDLQWFGNFSTGRTINVDFKDLTVGFLNNFDVVILVAGHSSVKMCDKDLQSSFNNNIRNFVNITSKLTTQKFIYASSASVYGNTTETNLSENSINFSPINYYDLTKLHIDHIIQLSDLEYYGLRFGTVNGPAPNIRSDVMINAMVDSAMQTSKIKVFNSNTHRSILGINDLCRAVDTIINDSRKTNRGIYNIASLTSTVGEIAQLVAEKTRTEIVNTDHPKKMCSEKLQNKIYDFGICTKKFENIFNFKFLETLETITHGTIESYATCSRSDRANLIRYH